MWTAAKSFVLFAALAGILPAAQAASLQVAPVRIDVPPRQAATKMTLRNTGNEDLNAQIRVFKWVQNKGKDELVETRDVVASPPIMKLVPGRVNTVRIVRTSKAPVAGEESYRLLIDQLPPPANKPGMAVSFVLRYSVPVFFAGAEQDGQRLNWIIETKGGHPVLSVTNTGSTHVRISSLSIRVGSGTPMSFGPGLVGYVLANSTARFPLMRTPKGLRPGATVLIAAEGNDGPVKAQAGVRAAN
jgi:fimbrial chaperone protein